MPTEPGFFFFFSPSPSPHACPEPGFFLIFFFLLLLPHLSGVGTHHLQPTQPSTTISGQTISGDSLHFWPNPTGKHRKTQTQPKKSILMHQTPFLMPQNSILMPQKSFLDLKLKPKF
jgi:hypothetical protein